MAPDLIGVAAANAAVLLVAALAIWGISIRTGDPSFIDACWGFGFVVVAAVSVVVTNGSGLRRMLLVAVPTVWGLRLGLYLLWRWRREGPDRRYQSMLRRVEGNPHLFTLRKVFLLQAGLLWVVSWPIQLGQAAPARAATALTVLGAVVALAGVLFESIGDVQLVRFRADATSAGKVLDTGLWRYTRHPNYFGDALFWWGVGLVSLGHPVTVVGLVGPALMTFLLLRWSGVPVLERHLGRRREGYAEYVARTSGFVPRRPRQRAG